MIDKSKHSIKISSFFTPDNIEIVNDKIEIDLLIHKLLENLALNYGIGNVQSIYTHLYKELKNIRSPFRINNNTILYHFRLTSSNDTRIAIAHLKNGIINSDKISDEQIKLIIIVTSPNAKPDIYLKIAKSFREFFYTNSNFEFLINQNNPSEIWNYIDKSNISLPETIYAYDVMQDIEVTLNESNNLKDAIDKFVRTGYLNIPVVDLEGNLAGEVTSHELMEVCLPRYILWMDDISPITNFEPFQNMLENEENTWLAEIMNHNCSVVQKDDPFIKAAINMTKKSVSHVYVLDDKKLIGIIPLRFFLQKILRE